MAFERWPDFLIIGAAKSGTTTLYNYLAAHPEVFMPSIKEPRFFAFTNRKPDPEDPILRDSIASEKAYLDLFTRAQPTQIIGEASPIYLADEEAPEAIAARLPTAKLVAILRDPAERAFSHFLMSQRQGYEPELDFQTALHSPSITIGSWKRTRPYLPYSRYGQGLQRYLALYPRSQILILFAEDLHREAG